jgi:hypothetical protein
MKRKIKLNPAAAIQSSNKEIIALLENAKVIKKTE